MSLFTDLGRQMMTLPSFIVIGAMRSGTTWLRGILDTHSKVFVADREIHFFDRHFDRGAAWYESQFPAEGEAYEAIGEKTPHYMFDPVVPERIRRVAPECRLIAILRNPADRAFSQYTRSIRDHADARTFEQFLDQVPETFEKGLYGQQLERYVGTFGRSELLMLLFEEATTRPQEAFAEIGSFLGIDPRGFDLSGAEAKANRSLTPKYPWLRRALVRGGRALRLSNSIGIQRAYRHLSGTGMARWAHRFVSQEKATTVALSSETRSVLMERYCQDMVKLEALLDVDVSCWRRREDV